MTQVTEKEMKEALEQVRKAENLAFKCHHAAIVLYVNNLLDKEDIQKASMVLQKNSWRWNKESD